LVTTLAVDIEGVTGGVEIGPDGNVYTADFTSGRIYRVGPGGDVELFVDSAAIGGASGNTFGADGALYQSSFPDGKVFRITLDGTVEEFATGLEGPVGIISDGESGFFVADCDARRIMAIDGTGEVSEFARHPDFNCPNGIARDDDGNLYMANFGDGKVFKVSPTGEAEQFAVLRGDNNGHLAFYEDRLYVLARGAHLLYAVDLDGTLSIVAGTGEFGIDDGAGDQATLNLPNDIDIDDTGRIYINQSSAPTTRNNPVAVRVIDVP
jgi:sugar lactone lactonase YvrE